MAIYHLKADGLEKLEQTNFFNEGIKERTDLQRVLRSQIDVLSTDTLVIAEEFGEWEDSRRRIDLLGIDKNANLVVIELKRTENGGFMDLQAIRYAAMISKLTFSKVVSIYGSFLNKLGDDSDPKEALLDFLEWDEPLEDEFAQDVKIILASAEFSKELTTSVIWLNNNGLDIRCVRFRPYNDNGKILLDVQQVLPLPEAEDYQVRIRDKEQAERVSRTQTRDLTKYTIKIGDISYERLPKRRALFQVVKFLTDSGINPEEINNLIPDRNNCFQGFDGHLSSLNFEKLFNEMQIEKGRISKVNRWFYDDNELIYANGKTFAFSKMWGHGTKEALESLIDAYPEYDISFTEAD